MLLIQLALINVSLFATAGEENFLEVALNG
jgi:hypothetical protein